MNLEPLAERLGQIEGATAELSMDAAALCTYRVGGPLGVFVRVDAVRAIAEVVQVIS